MATHIPTPAHEKGRKVVKTVIVAINLMSEATSRSKKKVKFFFFCIETLY